MGSTRLEISKDPKGVYPKDACSIISRRGFQEDQPEAATFFKTLILKKNSCTGNERHCR
jgi:glycine betaine/proline transport system substrate-binding protein